MPTRVKSQLRSKLTTTPVVDPAAQAAAEVVAAAMAALLLAEEQEDQKQPPPSKQGSSDKARKHKNRRKPNPDEPETDSTKAHDEAISGIAASSSGRGRDTAGGESDVMGRDAAPHSTSDGHLEAYGGEENAGPVFNNHDQSHNTKPEGSIGKSLGSGSPPSGDSTARPHSGDSTAGPHSGNKSSPTPQEEATSTVECAAGASHSGEVEQPTTTPAELQKERERKGKQRQRKNATIHAALKEALAQVDSNIHHVVAGYYGTCIVVLC
jgi:hypothetical protein